MDPVDSDQDLIQSPEATLDSDHEQETLVRKHDFIDKCQDLARKFQEQVDALTTLVEYAFISLL